MVLINIGGHKRDLQEGERGVSGEDTEVHRRACEFRSWSIGRIIRWLKRQGLSITPPIAVKEGKNEICLIYPTCWIRIRLKEENGVCMIDEALHCMPVEVEESFPPERKVKMMCFPL